MKEGENQGHDQFTEPIKAACLVGPVQDIVNVSFDLVLSQGQLQQKAVAQRMAERRVVKGSSSSDRLKRRIGRMRKPLAVGRYHFVVFKFNWEACWLIDIEGYEEH